jgi:signal transduction histidine kinase
VIDNAVKYSPADGTIEIGVRREGRACILTVRDHGPGLSSDDTTLATDRFWRSTDTAEIPGTGLGLSIAVDLLSSIDGELTVDAPQGGGLAVSLVVRDGVPS